MTHSEFQQLVERARQRLLLAEWMTRHQAAFRVIMERVPGGTWRE